jgi:hypothetical protein
VLGGALALAVAVGALGTLAACTGGGSGDSGNDAKSSQGDGVTLSPAPPGKYKTLPQPCIAVDLDTLKALVPGAADYAGTEALTYDTDRRVGCTWQAKGTDGSTRKLTIDMERVVSYDPQVSDEVEAGVNYDNAAAAASIPPLPLPGSTPTTTAPPGQDAPGSADSAGTSGASGATAGGTATPTSGDAGDDGKSGGTTDLAPRRLTDVGNAAFIYDTLSNGKGKPRCDVTLVFRTANVVVTVHYDQASPSATVQPDRADLQEDTEKVARQLEHKVEG